VPVLAAEQQRAESHTLTRRPQACLTQALRDGGLLRRERTFREGILARAAAKFVRNVFDHANGRLGKLP
jgi:hypothetical protein